MGKQHTVTKFRDTLSRLRSAAQAMFVCRTRQKQSAEFDCYRTHLAELREQLPDAADEISRQWGRDEAVRLAEVATLAEKIQELWFTSGIVPQSADDALRIVSALDTEVSRLRNLSAAAAATPRTPRLAVDIAKLTVTLDGKTHDVNSEQALRWVKVLLDHPGEWISAADMEKYDRELIDLRTNRLRGMLPADVAKLVDSETGKGSRIRLA